MCGYTSLVFGVKRSPSSFSAPPGPVDPALPSPDSPRVSRSRTGVSPPAPPKMQKTPIFVTMCRSFGPLNTHQARQSAGARRPRGNLRRVVVAAPARLRHHQVLPTGKDGGLVAVRAALPIARGQDLSLALARDGRDFLATAVVTAALVTTALAANAALSVTTVLPQDLQVLRQRDPWLLVYRL